MLLTKTKAFRGSVSFAQFWRFFCTLPVLWLLHRTELSNIIIELNRAIVVRSIYEWRYSCKSELRFCRIVLRFENSGNGLSAKIITVCALNQLLPDLMQKNVTQILLR